MFFTFRVSLAWKTHTLISPVFGTNWDKTVRRITAGSPVCRSWCRWGVRWRRSCRSTSRWEPWTERLRPRSTPPLQPHRSASSSLESDTVSYPLHTHNTSRTANFTQNLSTEVFHDWLLLIGHTDTASASTCINEHERKNNHETLRRSLLSSSTSASVSFSFVYYSHHKHPSHNSTNKQNNRTTFLFFVCLIWAWVQCKNTQISNGATGFSPRGDVRLCCCPSFSWRRS